MIIALHENQLTINMFTKEEKSIPSTVYAYKNNIIANFYQDRLSFYDSKLQLIESYMVSACKSLSFTENGTYCVFLSSERNLYVFKGCKKYLEIPLIVNFSISEFYLLTQNTSKIVEEHFLWKTTVENCSYFKVLRDLIIKYDYVEEIIEENVIKQCKLEIIGKEKTFTKNFDQIAKLDAKIDDKNNLLILITSKYISNSYYGHDKVYFYNSIKNQLNEVKCKDPPLFFDFFNNQIAICSGHQPCDVSFYDYDGNYIKSTLTCVQNKFYINNHSNLMAFCGFENLSGNITIYDLEKKEFLTQFKVKGASLFYWSPNGSYFCVSITNYMKDDNCIIVYDYFGREIHKRNFDSLSRNEWIGNKEPFVLLERPENLLIEKESVYTISFLDNLPLKNKKKPFVKKKELKQVKKETPSKTKEEIILVLKNIQELKTKNPLDLNTTELNLLLKEDKFREELNEIEK